MPAGPGAHIKHLGKRELRQQSVHLPFLDEDQAIILLIIGGGPDGISFPHTDFSKSRLAHVPSIQAKKTPSMEYRSNLFQCTIFLIHFSTQHVPLPERAAPACTEGRLNLHKG